MRSKQFWQDAGERSVKTFCQTLSSLLVAGPAVGVLQVSFSQCLWVSFVAAAVSILTSVGSTQVGNATTASLLK